VAALAVAAVLVGVQHAATRDAAPPAPAPRAAPSAAFVSPTPSPGVTAAPVAVAAAPEPRDLVEMLQEPYTDPRAERRALHDALVASGPPGAWAAEATTRIDELIAALPTAVGRGVAVADRRCHGGGCVIALEYRDPSVFDDTRRLRDLGRLPEWPGGTIQTAPITDDHGVISQDLILLPPPGGSF